MGYVDEVLEVVKKKNADQPEFLQAEIGRASCRERV